ncbi:MAG: acyl-CoA desaturase [Sumerlaeia bacterium]
MNEPANPITWNPNEFLWDFVRNIPFLSVHLACLLAFVCGFSWWAVGLCVLLYAVRMFGITAGFHRYFSHRSYSTSRVFQFLIALLGTSAAQRGPLWWAAHHRHHHRHSDTELDTHSPVKHGFIWSHIGWTISRHSSPTNYKAVRDLMKFPELVFLNRFHLLAPMILAISVFLLGWYLGNAYPESGINGFQFLIWGFFISTVLLYHGTFTINSLCHVIGSKRFQTNDESRNNLLLALITLGEGWHNNHHRYPSSERQGFYWWEIDLTHVALRLLSLIGIVWDLRTPPKHIYDEAENNSNKIAAL